MKRFLMSIAAAALAAVTMVFPCSPVKAQAASKIAQANPHKLKIGDRVEIDSIGSKKYWTKGVIIPFHADDMFNGYLPDSGYFYRVRLDGYDLYPEGQLSKAVDTRPEAASAADKANNAMAAAAPAAQPAVEVQQAAAQPSAVAHAAHAINNSAHAVQATGTVPANRPLLECPCKQPTAHNGTRPDPEILRRVMRCALGEKPAPPGLDGAVTIDIASLQIGTPRPFDLKRDLGGGQIGTTIVYPVKIAFTEKIHYRSGQEIYANRIRIVNCFVNAFGEWQYGSHETIKEAEISRVNY